MNQSRYKPILVLGTVLLMAASCVPNRKVAYLQYGDELSSPETIVTDSLVRAYESGEMGYMLQPGDLLSITIASNTPEAYNPFYISDRFMVPGNSMINNRQSQDYGYRIDPAGNLNLPVLGVVPAAGKTLRGLEKEINALAASQLEDPVTRINILNFRFSVVGEVEQENTLTTNDNALTLLQALSMAGGPSEFGDISRVKVIRSSGDRHLVYYVNLLDESFLGSEFYFVQPNDVIVVTPLKSRSYLKYANPNISIFTSSVSLLLAIVTLLTLLKT